MSQQEAAVANGRKKRTNTLGLLAGVLVGAAVGGASGVLFANIDTWLGITGVHSAVMVLLLVLAVFLSLFVHEYGHLAGGMLTGMRPLLLVVGPFRWQREGERMRMSWNRSIALAGGIAASVPPDERDLRRRMALMVAAGPAMSLLLAVAGACLMLARLNPTLTMFGVILAFFSALICVVTLVPLRTGGMNSDGARLLMLARGGPVAERYVAVLALVSASLGGVRPRDWNAGLVERSLSVPDASSDHLSAQWMAYTYALDQGQVAEAGEMLDGVLDDLDTWPVPLRTGVLLEAAYFVARHRQQPDAARALLERAGPGVMISASTRLSAEAAVLLAEGKVAEARSKAQQGINLLSHSIGGVSPVERERLEEVVASA